jgi:hypothetical protein
VAAPVTKARPPADPQTKPARVAMPALSDRSRPIVVWTLIGLATLIGFLSMLATWVNRQLLDNSNWSTASTKLIEDTAIQSAVSVYVVNELYDNVDVSTALQQRLPTNLKPLAAPAAAALREPASTGVQFLLSRPRVQQKWIDASTAAHAQLVAVLENKTTAGVSTANGTVTLDLSQLLQEIGPDLGLPASAVSKLPDDAGVFTVMRSDQLKTGQQVVRAVRVLSVWLLTLTLLLYALAIYLAAPKRREAIRGIGCAIGLVGIALLLIRSIGGHYAIDALAPRQYREAAHHAWLILSSVLGELGWALVLYGLLAVLGAALAGPTRAAVAIRRAAAPVLNHRPGLTWGTAGAVFLLFVLWGGTHALRTPLGILVLGALTAAGVAALRRQTLHEFPHAAPAPSGGQAIMSAAAEKVTASAAAVRRGVTAAIPTLAPSTGSDSVADKLIALGALHDKGQLTDEEFARAKELLLG